MSVERAPYKRPSLPGILHDSHDRVKSLEAGQMMPYTVGSASFNWPPNTRLPVDMGSISNQVMGTVVFVNPAYFITLNIESTDDSIFTYAGGGVGFMGGGLFYHHVRVLVEGDSLVAATAGATVYLVGSSGVTAFYPGYKVDKTIVPSRPFALYPSYPNENLQMGLYPDYYDEASFVGWVSDLGLENGDPSGAPAASPYSGSKLEFLLRKGAAADDVTFTITWMVARWTPIGFGVWSGE